MAHQREITETESGLCLEHFRPEQRRGGPPILFVHGNFCGSWCWQQLMGYFAARGRSCYAVNFRGHWLSKGHASLGAATTEDYVADVEASLEVIEDKPIVVGHSMGGLVSQKVAEQNQIAALILLDSGPCKQVTETHFRPNPQTLSLLQDMFKPAEDGTVSLAPNLQGIKEIFYEKDKVDDETLAQTAAYLGRESAAVVSRHAFTPVDPAQVQCPVFVLGRTGLGSEEQPDLWHALADYFKAQDRFISDEISHNMFMETDWERHAQRIGQWCDQV